MLLAALFVTGRLSQQNELAAMKSSGMSLYRFLAPFAVVAFGVSVAGIYFNGWVVPYANQTKFDIERMYLQDCSAHGSFSALGAISPSKPVFMGIPDSLFRSRFQFLVTP